MNSSARHPHYPSDMAASETRGKVLDHGWRYDLIHWFVDAFLLHGKHRELQRRTLDLAALRAGEQVLDVGCGTGALALDAQQRIGPTGRAVGIDPSVRQIARARAKAARRRLPADFQVGVIEHLHFPDETFDVVFSTMMMHHLPDDLKREGLMEIARVLKPGGRLAIADFRRQDGNRDQPAQLGAGARGAQDLPALVTDAGFTQVATEEMSFPRLPGHAGAGVGFVRAYKP